MQYQGTIKKVYLPKQLGKDGFLYDVHKTMIGFEVLVGNKTIKIELPQNEGICQICREEVY